MLDSKATVMHVTVKPTDAGRGLPSPRHTGPDPRAPLERFPHVRHSRARRSLRSRPSYRPVAEVPPPSGFAAYPRFITVSSCPRGCLGLSFERFDVAPLPDGCVSMF